MSDWPFWLATALVVVVWALFLREVIALLMIPVLMVRTWAEYEEGKRLAPKEESDD